MPSNHEAKCGRCKVAVGITAEDNGVKRGTCPRCGETDTVPNIMKILGDYVREKAAIDLHDAMKQATRGSKIMKLTGSPPTKRKHRFIV